MANTYDTRQAARRIGVSFRTLNRWLGDGTIKPSRGVPYGGGRTLWRWTDADIAKGRKIKAAQRTGTQPRSKREERHR